jgi:hypothetical protein
LNPQGIKLPIFKVHFIWNAVMDHHVHYSGTEALGTQESQKE